MCITNPATAGPRDYCVLKFSPSNQVTLLPRPIDHRLGDDVLQRGQHRSVAVLPRALRDHDLDPSRRWVELVEHERSLPGVDAGHYGSSNASLSGTVNAHYIGAATFPGQYVAH